MPGTWPKPALPQFPQRHGFNSSFWEPPHKSPMGTHTHPFWSPFKKKGGQNGSWGPAPVSPSPTPPRDGVSMGLGGRSHCRGGCPHCCHPRCGDTASVGCWHHLVGVGPPNTVGKRPLVSHPGGPGCCFRTDGLWPPASCILSGDAEPLWGCGVGPYVSLILPH